MQLRQNEAGESTASIRKRADLEAWPRVLEALETGGVLYRPQKLDRFFTQCVALSDRNNGIGISQQYVKKLIEAGVLVRVGVDTYSLNKKV